MRAADFSKDWKRTREIARESEKGEYEPILANHDGEEYEVAKWSRYSSKYDLRNIDNYLKISTTQFGESLGEMLDHTMKTGIGKIVTFREEPRYVLDPGRRWRSHQAARFGISPTRYRDAIRRTRTVQRMMDAEGIERRKDVLTLQAQLEAAEAALEDIKFDYAAQEEEVRHLRREVARMGSE